MDKKRIRYFFFCIKCKKSNLDEEDINWDVCVLGESLEKIVFFLDEIFVELKENCI